MIASSRACQMLSTPAHVQVQPVRHARQTISTQTPTREARLHVPTPLPNAKRTHPRGIVCRLSKPAVSRRRTCNSSTLNLGCQHFHTVEHKELDAESVNKKKNTHMVFVWSNCKGTIATVYSWGPRDSRPSCGMECLSPEESFKTA